MPKGYSLHIGLNSVDPAHYNGWSGNLTACENDARSMQSICTLRGFTAKTLLTKQATRTKFLTELNSAAAALKAGDTFVLSYSGHGGQLPDQNGDEDDSLDETWCLYDGELLDDELFRCWGTLPAGVRVAVFSDSCHSGTLLKMNAMAGGMAADDSGELRGRKKAMPREVMISTYYSNQKFYDKLLAKAAPADPKCSVLLVSGCQDNQFSYDGPFNGAFTSALMVVFQNGQFKGSYPDFTQRIRARLPGYQSPNFMTVGVPDATFEKGPVFSF